MHHFVYLLFVPSIFDSATQKQKQTKKKTSYDNEMTSKVKIKVVHMTLFAEDHTHRVFCEGVPQGSILEPIILWTVLWLSKYM